MLLSEGQIRGIHQHCGSSPIEGSSTSRVQHTIQVESSADQPQMCEDLRKVRAGFALRSGLLCVQVEMVGIVQHALEYQPGLVQLFGKYLACTLAPLQAKRSTC